MVKRLLSIILCILMVVAAFAGCQKEQPVKDGSGTQDDVSPVGVGKEMVGNMYTEGYPIVKNKVTYRIMSPKAPTSKPFEEMVFFQKLEELTNVHIEWDQAESDYNTKKNVMLASGDYPDAFYSEGSLNTNDVSIYGPQGILIDLSELMDKYGTNYNKLAKEDPLLDKIAKYVDGNVYALPAVHGFDVDLINLNRIWISQVWLDKLQLKMPETIDDFYNVLKAFKEKDPNENGQPDEIPFTFRFNSDLQGLTSLIGSFGRPDPGSHLLLDEETGKVIFTADKPEWKEAVIYLHNKMFKEDLFDKEGFTQTVPQFFAKGRSEVQIIGAGSIFVANNLVGVDRVKDFPAMPPLKGPGGTTPMWHKQSELQTYYKTVSFAITNTCKNPEILMRWVDTFYEPKMSIQALYGPEGVTLREEDGIFKWNPIPEGMSFDEFRYKDNPPQAAAAFYAAYYDKYIEVPETKKYGIEVYNNVYKPYMKLVTFPSNIYSAKDDAEYLKIKSEEIGNHVNDNLSKWLLEGGIEAEWDSYLQKLDQLELKQYLDVNQKVYDNFMSSN